MIGKKRRPKLTKKNLEALRASIAHWDRNSRARSPLNISVGANGCALCELHLNRVGSCFKCPVVTHGGGSPGCEGTPHSDLRLTNAYVMWRYPYRVADVAAAGREFRAKARKELAFLKSILPEDEQ